MFGFPKEPRNKNFKYKNNLLKSATFQLKFSPPAAFAQNKRREIEALFTEKFPSKQDVVKSEIAVTLGKDKTPVLDSAASSVNGLEFRTKNSDEIFVLTEESFSYIIFGGIYTNFDTVLQELKKYLFPAMKICGISSASRISIRKINVMESAAPEANLQPALLFRETYKESLIQHIVEIPVSEYVESGISNIVLRSNGYILNLNYGIIPKEQWPNASKPLLLLDIDLISSGEFESNLIESEWEKINAEIFNVFNWALNKNLKNSLNN